ncbi:MAG: helix-turn-helix domain-containing protein [Firmicutes bacterium]|nr:helix-turn-helix domain-containing protein [Bacillota bacterium]
MSLAKNIKTLRKEKGLTQEALAKDLDIGRGALAHYEAGDRQVPSYLVPKIAKYFNVSIDYLYGEREE